MITWFLLCFLNHSDSHSKVISVQISKIKGMADGSGGIGKDSSEGIETTRAHTRNPKP